MSNPGSEEETCLFASIKAKLATDKTWYSTRLAAIKGVTDHNKFMDQCKALGINVLIDVLNKPDWAGTARGAYSTGDGTKATDYLDKLEFMGQLVARYGAQKIDKSKLETADKVSGLNYIKYYEDDNEPDYWWETSAMACRKIRCLLQCRS